MYPALIGSGLGSNSGARFFLRGGGQMTAILSIDEPRPRGTVLGERADRRRVREAEHYFRCKSCGGFIDGRDLVRVEDHDGPCRTRLKMESSNWRFPRSGAGQTSARSRDRFRFSSAGLVSRRKDQKKEKVAADLRPEPPPPRRCSKCGKEPKFVGAMLDSARAEVSGCTNAGAAIGRGPPTRRKAA
jgi:hypothetical protein